ncbi:glycosyltransferase family 4 protein [Mucilaginibacter sp. Bleaf8]|uniref:glycosyltransferase family 4 protein n=1 Tax=Mucilaginibacter sp. Bleaf8 TaxID=2834430 RepID=UPI001BCFADD2|nr:glycosyltransferase family 4 protein [Mucilaginibacter sp. Bleaf8]MBS7566812.1 glycosyltransferase family 4 protein [Mucilaginibacter sp. Bleaf8]
MRILLIHCAYQYLGGEDITVVKELDLLRSKGNEVEILLFANESAPLANLLQLPFNIKSYRATQKKIDAFKPDVVHIHNLHFSGSTSVIYAVKKRAAVVYTLHNYRLICPSGTLFNNGQPYLRSMETAFPLKAVFNRVYKGSWLLTFWLALTIGLNNISGVWKQVNRFIVLTNDAKKLIEKSKLSVIPAQLAVKPNFTDYTAKADVVRNSHFLYVGRLSDEKGIKVLLEAFVGSPYTLDIIGDGPYNEYVKTIAETHANINYCGFQDKQAITTAMQQCTALIFPSIWYETFGLTIIEAFAVATPVIASNIGAASALVSHCQNGLHFEPGNANSLIQAVHQWAGYPDEIKSRYRQNAMKTYQEHYTPDHNYEQLMAIYNQAIVENHASYSKH